MNNPILNNENFISVVPRIIDPEMKFTTKSIQNLNNANGKHNKVPNKQITQQAVKNTKDIAVPTLSFYNNYKYIIIIGLIVIGLIVIILLIYYLYKKNKDKQTKIHNKESIGKDSEDAKKSTDNVSSGGTDSAEKKKNIDKYISNYILNDDEDSDSEGEDDEQISTKDELNTTTVVENTAETHSPEADENMTDNNIIHQKMQEQRMQQQYIQQQQMQQFQQLQQLQHFQQMQNPQVVNTMDTNNLTNNLNLHNTQMPNMIISGIMEVSIGDNTDNIISPNDNIIEELTSEVDYDIDDFLNTNETLNTDIISNDVETIEDEIVIINESDDEIKIESIPDTISESNNKNIDIIMKSDAAKKTYNKNKKKSAVSNDDELNYFKKFVK